MSGKKDSKNIPKCRGHIKALETTRQKLDKRLGKEFQRSDYIIFSLVSRLLALAPSAIDAMESKNQVLAAVLARACGETTALLWFYLKKLASGQDSRAREKLELQIMVGFRKDFMEKFLEQDVDKCWADENAAVRESIRVTHESLRKWNSNQKIPLPEPVHVTKAIRAAKNDIRLFDALYDLLSEYAHPNAFGCSAAIDHENEAMLKGNALQPSTSRNMATAIVGPFLRISLARAVECTAGVTLECMLDDVNEMLKELQKDLDSLKE